MSKAMLVNSLTNTGFSLLVCTAALIAAFDPPQHRHRDLHGRPHHQPHHHEPHHHHDHDQGDDFHKRGDSYAHNRNEDHDSWGKKGGGASGYGREWNDAGSERNQHEHASKAYDRGGNDWARGRKGDHHFNDNGHEQKEKESGERAGHDADGRKHFRYFAEGNGPDGFYSRGYYGSNDYEHGAEKAAESHRATGEHHDKSDDGAHKAHAHGSEGHDHAGAKHHFDKAADHHSSSRLEKGENANHHHNEGWKSSNADNGWQNGFDNFHHGQHGDHHEGGGHGHAVV